jgi:nitrile hydratase subunit beta
MDGVHDLGGMQGFGGVEREANEPVFHAPWEAAVLAIMRAGWGRGCFNLDEFRHAIERMRPAEYLTATYYEKWLDGITRLLLEKGVVKPEEMENRAAFFRARPDASAAAALQGPLPARVPFDPAFVQGVTRETGARPRFSPGDRVVTRVMHPRGHTRLPRYARGKRGLVHLVHGVHVFPDTHAHGLGESPQPLYSVRFEARELWGDTGEPNQWVHLDLWESYLEPGRPANG